MDQELTQRLVGAFVITALLAIFVPMMFDDDVDQTGKSINQLSIPEVPAKVQDVEIMPLPEKAEDVATVIPVEKPGAVANKSAIVSEGEAEPIVNAPAPAPATQAKSLAKSAAKPGPGQTFEPDADMAQEGLIAEDELPLRPTGKPVKAPAVTAPAAAVQAQLAPAAPATVANSAAAVQQPVVKVPVKPVTVSAPVAPSPAVAVAPSTAPVPVAKSASATPEGSTRWYLNAGSFTQRANAVALQESLKRQGFAATVKDAQGEKGPIFKVRIGPIQDKAKAQEVKNRLLQLNVNTFVAADE